MISIMFSMSRKVHILTLLLVILTILGMLALNIMGNWKSIVDHEFQKTESIAKLLDSQIPNFEELLAQHHFETDEEKINFLNKQLQPFIEDITQSFPGYGAGYYSKELNSIVAFGPSFHLEGLKDIRPDSLARTVYKTGEMFPYREYSQTRESNVIATIYPIIRDGEVIGHVWGNIAINDVYQILFEVIKERIIFILFIIVLAVLGSRWISGQYERNIKLFKKKVQEGDKDIPTVEQQLLPEILDIYNEVLLSREKISESQKKFQRVITKKIMHAQEEERARLSRDLHDGVGQALYSILVGISVLKREKIRDEVLNHINELESLTKDTMFEIKEISRQLRPSMLDDLGFLPTIRSFISKYEKRFHIKVELKADLSKKRFAPEEETALYRIFQEALNNAAKYSETDKIDIEIIEIEDNLHMIIRDYGKGFIVENEQFKQEGRGLGLYSMKERASQIGGEAIIESTLNKGTTVKVIIPR